MQEAKTLKGYKRKVDEAMSKKFQRTALDNFAVAYRQGRKRAFEGLDTDGLIAQIAAAKDDSIARMEELYEAFREKAEANGIRVHLAKTAHEANEIIARIAKETGTEKIVKSKSMTAEETLLNHHLEAQGLVVTETDLGEWIIQLRKEGPSHMVMPAIHLSRNEVAKLFTDVTGQHQETEIEQLVKVARRELRQRYVEADMGISGANFAIAETGTIGIITNEGNARLVTTLPRVHVALVGLEKLTPTLHDALRVLRVLPKNATGQLLTSYVTWITGPNACASASDGKKEMHIVFLDNGRTRMAKDPVFSQTLRCIRCGACANVCPIYRMIGGHEYGHIYIGAIGLILTYFFHGKENARNIVQNCLNCRACKSVCAAGIDLPRIIKSVFAKVQDEEGHPMSSLLLGKVLKNRKLFHGMLRAGRSVQKPVTKDTVYLRHLPGFLFKEHSYKAIPAIAQTPFRDSWEHLQKPVENPKCKVALFAGCVQDFVYPEQLEAGYKVMAERGAAVDFPMEQTCCGLPAAMMGERDAAKAVAIHNITAVDPGKYDYIVALCASCASHLKEDYPQLLRQEMENDPGLKKKVEAFAEKIIPFSALVHDVLGPPEREAGTQIQEKAGMGHKEQKKVTLHSPCHLCRGVTVKDAPHNLIREAGHEFLQAEEEETCCGFGGTYSAKFANVSAEILKRKLDDFEKTGAEMIVTECPGCVMQLRGGMEKRGRDIAVKHIAELLSDQK